MIESTLMMPVALLVFIVLIEVLFVFTARSVMFVSASEAANMAMELTRGYNPSYPTLGHPLTPHQADQVCNAVRNGMRVVGVQPNQLQITIYDLASTSSGSGGCRVAGGGAAPRELRIEVDYEHEWFHRKISPIGARSMIIPVSVSTQKQIFEGVTVP